MVVHDIFVRFGTNLKAFNKEIFKTQTEFKKLENKSGTLNQRFRKLGRSGAKLGREIRFATTGFRGFKMELLSVMFGAQMVSQALFGLLQPAMQAVGIFDVWSTILQVVFLPIALWLLENVLLPLMDWFLNLSPNTQMAIGAIILISAVFFKLLSVGAALMLFFGGLILIFGSVGVGLAAIGIFLGVFIIAVIAVIAIIALLWLAFKSNFLGMGDLFSGVWEAIVETFRGAWMIIKGIWEVLAGIFTGDWTRVWEGIKTIASGIWRILTKGVWKLVKTIVKFLWELPGKVMEMMEKFVQAMWDGLIWVWTHRAEIAAKILDALKAAGTKIMDWAKDIGKRMWDAILGKITNLAKGVLKFLGLSDEGEGESVKGSSQTGGYIPHTGLYKLHAGESVNQAGTNNFNNNITVYASSNVDIEMLKTQLSTAWSEDLSRLSRR